MNEIYWITRMDTITTILIVLLVIFALLTWVFFLGYTDKTNNSKLFKNLSIISLVSTFIFTVAVALTPNTKDLLMIYGVGGVVDYIKENNTAKQLPDKAIKALDKLVDDYLKEDKDN